MARTGRPRGFDRDQAVVGAMHAFWEYGFDGTSLERLREAMGGISSASFYAAFGSKEALYREAVARYLETHGRVATALRDETLAPRARLETALRDSARMQADPSHPTGCMVALAAATRSNDSSVAHELTARERAANRHAIRECVRSAVDSGELGPDTDIDGLATLFDGLLVGISIAARDGVGAASLDAAITNALAAWDASATGFCFAGGTTGRDRCKRPDASP
ncbi:MAG: TetR/AcrR family transcriptional regulator [Mycobacteriales bacterium]